MSKFTKVAIIGAGAVGTATAYSILTRGICSEIVLIDINKEKAFGEILDMQHSIDYQTRNVKLLAGEYSDCKDADIVVLTVAAPTVGVKDRQQLRDITAKILSTVVPNVMSSGFNGIFLVVSNPVDSMTNYVKKLSGLPHNKVIGTGTILETARLKFILGQIANVNLRSIEACVVGEHGESMSIPWSHVRVGGKKFTEILLDNQEKYRHINLDEIHEKTRLAGHEVMKAKGNTQFGIASAVATLVTAILHDECKLYPVSAYLEGQYGIEGTYCGVPAIIGREGVIDIGVYKLEDNEIEKLRKSSEIIKASFENINLN